MASKFFQPNQNLSKAAWVLYDWREPISGKHGILFILRSWMDWKKHCLMIQARKNRAIVIHGGRLRHEAFAKTNGRLGGSLGVVRHTYPKLSSGS